MRAIAKSASPSQPKGGRLPCAVDKPLAAMAQDSLQTVKGKLPRTDSRICRQ